LGVVDVVVAGNTVAVDADGVVAVVAHAAGVASVGAYDDAATYTAGIGVGIAAAGVAAGNVSCCCCC